MGIKTKKPTIDPLVKELLQTVRELQKSTASVVEQCMAMQAENAKMMAGMFEMWKPPSTPNQSSGLDQRLLAKEDAANDTDWEPLDPHEMMEIVKQVGAGV